MNALATRHAIRKKRRNSLRGNRLTSDRPQSRDCLKLPAAFVPGPDFKPPVVEEKKRPAAIPSPSLLNARRSILRSRAWASLAAGFRLFVKAERSRK